MTRGQAHVILSEVMKEPNLCLGMAKLVMVLRHVIEGEFAPEPEPVFVNAAYERSGK